MKNLATTLLILVAPLWAKAQIIYHDITPDEVVNLSDYEVNIGCSPDSCHLYPTQNIKISLNSGGGWVYCQNEVKVLVDPLGRAMALSFAQPIEAGSPWSSNSQALLNNGVGNWVSVANKYLGVRMLKAGQWHHGWVRMDIGANGTYGVVKDYAFNAQPNEPIAAGKVLTTSVNDVRTDREGSMFLSGRELKVSDVKRPSVLVITSMDGKILLKKDLLNEASISLEAFAPGIYAVQLINAMEKKALKIVVN